METMLEGVQAILAKQLRVDPGRVVPEARIKKDLGADSVSPCPRLHAPLVAVAAR